LMTCQRCRRLRWIILCAIVYALAVYGFWIWIMVKHG